MIILSAERLHWINDAGTDDPADLCAHSPVTCEVEGVVIARPEDGDWTVSASAIFLLRALDRDHTKEAVAGEPIFPCCGNGIYEMSDGEVAIIGCSSGIDFEIRAQRETYEFTLEDGRIVEVPKEDWRDAVLRYSAQVMAFYDRSAPKEPFDQDDRKGFIAMMSEWRRLHAKHTRAE